MSNYSKGRGKFGMFILRFIFKNKKCFEKNIQNEIYNQFNGTE